MIDCILKWFNLVCSLLALAIYIYTPQADQSLGILAIMSFLVFRYCDDKINRVNDRNEQRNKV